MTGVRLILALHDHQPVGNFDGVFEAAYRDSYLPFLEVLESYPQIPFVLHTSGPLLEWLVERRPEYIQRVRALVEAGRVEILGGGFFEPILTMLPRRDAIGQIRDFSDHVAATFGQPPRGIWVPERVWEPQLASTLASAGVEYTVLDDFHFRRAGLDDGQLFGYYLTEDEGRLLKVFPNCERLRYNIPFREPHESYEFLREVARDHPGATVVFADDGEKFGAWPDTHDHVYHNGWLRRFCDMIVGNHIWLHPTTFSQTLDTTLPLGKVYLPDSSYREMTEWALPAPRLLAYEAAARLADRSPEALALKPFAHAGGSWRNFKSKYAESDEMYARMLLVSERLERLSALPDADPDYLDVARQDLYRAQCNCPYWHGAFGGLYLPHLRNAIYRHLILADNALDEAQGLTGPRVSLEVNDFNLDARQEVRLENDRLIAFLRPATGGHLYELDIRHALTNVLATLDRRPEAYHGAIAAAAAGHSTENLPGPAIQDKVILKQEGLDRLLIYDRHPRKALIDHVFADDTTLADLIAGRDVERGDFVNGAYLSRVRRSAEIVEIVMERPGLADGHGVRVRKTVRLVAGSPSLDVLYEWDDLPEGVPLLLAVELNHAAMAGHAPDRYYTDANGHKLGPLSTALDLPMGTGLTLNDEWLDLAIGLRWSRPAALWCFPIETVSQSEGGFESVYQSSAVIPRWVVTADQTRHWDVSLTWTFQPATRPNAEVAADSPLALHLDV